MGSVSVSSCRCMFVSCVHPVAVLNTAFCMTCSRGIMGRNNGMESFGISPVWCLIIQAL